MTTLYIGNAMRQTYEFSYRAPIHEVMQRPMRSHMIPPGTYIQIPGPPGGWDADQVDDIIGQHAPYGLVRETDKAEGYHGTVYSVDRPIERQRLFYIMDRNLGVLVQQGQEIRRANAVAQSELVNRALVENGRTERVEVYDTTIQQENQDPKNDVPQMSVGTLVDARSGSGSRPRGRQRKAA